MATVILSADQVSDLFYSRYKLLTTSLLDMEWPDSAGRIILLEKMEEYAGIAPQGNDHLVIP